MNAARSICLPETFRNQRFDRAICEALAALGRQVSVREVRQALKDGRILVDGRPCAPGDRARGGEELGLDAFVARSEAVVRPEPDLLARVTILHEDPELLVLDKPSGVPSHPLKPMERGTLLGAAVAFDPAIGEAGPRLEGGLAHRLDIGTSGVLVFARTPAQRLRLRDAFASHDVDKRYLALVRGTLADTETIDLSITRGATPDRVRVVPPRTAGALSATTVINVLARFVDGTAWVEARTMTGRRHQIRAHLAALGAPIIGDPIYGAGPEPRLERLGLHAASVGFEGGLRFVAPISGTLEEAVNALGRVDCSS